MVEENLKIIKRDGSKELIQIDKLHKMVEESCRGIRDVSESEIEINSRIQFYDGITTNDITNILIKSAADLISEETPNYQYVAAKLVNFQLRKDVYGSHHIPTLWEHLNKVISLGYYAPDYLTLYSEEEIKKIDKFIWHDRDFDLTYCAMEQFRGKYLVKNRVTDEIYETPQFLYILIAMMMFSRYPKETRLKWVKDYYEAISMHYISLPSPIMAKMRTPDKQLSSCTLIDVDDSLDSITDATSAIVKYVAMSAGIGINVGRIRAINSSIRGGKAYSTGVIPYLKLFQAAVGSCNQGGIRKGSATCYFPIWHLEIEDLIVLKNNKGTEENRVRNMDYGVQINKLFYERLIRNENITLFSPQDVPDLYELFFTSEETFKLHYEQAEKNPNLRKKVIKALDLFTNIMNERANTGRIYIMNADNCNNHSPFYDTVYMSNLCTEILLKNVPMGADDSEISLCTLSAINWGKVKEPKDFEKYCNLAVRALNELLDIQDYLVPESERNTKKYRPLGIGIINFAYFLAKNNVKWGTPEALELVDKFAEAWSYYLIKASNDIMKEQFDKGTPIPKIIDIKYNNGILPIDTRKKEVDNIISYVERMPWEQLREDLKIYGIRNATLLAIAPTETSAQISNATNGIEPPRSVVSIKQSKDGVIKQVIPESKKLRNKYELLWDMKRPEPYLKNNGYFTKIY